MRDERAMSRALQAKVRSLRRNANMTLDSLAEATGISKSYLWEIENRKVPIKPSAEKLAAIAAVFRVTVDYLLEEAVEDPQDRHLDDAFFRNYKSLDPEDKKHVRRILETFRKS
jgi:transcriptional regulator with XRE-family HTH domain